MPVFNGARYLREALDSVLHQTYGPLEIIVVDDGSTDDSAAITATYGDRLCCLRQANAGPAAARNRGIGAARADFLAFLDADDLWPADKLAKQMERFAAVPSLELCVGHLQNFWSPELSPPNHAVGEDAALPGYVMSTALARRRVFDRIGLLNPALRYGEDTEWFLRAQECGIATELLPDVLCRRRLHENNMTRKRTVAQRDADLLNSVKAHLDRTRRGAS